MDSTSLLHEYEMLISASPKIVIGSALNPVREINEIARSLPRCGLASHGLAPKMRLKLIS
jgi:hypothetical protein